MVSRPARRGLALAALLGALPACRGAAPLPAAPDAFGTRRPGVLLLDGREVSWESLLARGGPTLAVFATTWCAACRQEQPAVEAWALAHPEVPVLYVFSGDALPAVRAEVESRGLSSRLVTAVVDAEGRLADRYGITATPTLLVLGRDGAMTGSHRRIDDVRIPESASAMNSSEDGRPGPGWVAVEDHGRELGTSYEVVVLARPGEEERARRDLAQARQTCRSLEERLSEWREDSEVSLLNQRAGREAVPVSPLLRQLVAGALHVAEVTGGTFDFTWAPLGKVWDEAERRGRLPSQAEIASVLPALGWRNVVLEGEGARFRHPGTRIGVASFAKGWIIDAVFLELQQRGHHSLVVNIGGDLRTAGPDAGGRAQVFQILDPYAPDRPVAQLAVADTAIATSGNYFRRRIIGGKAYGHIFDPVTGHPPAFDGSVTVLTRDAAMADALATALFVMGPERGLAFARGVPGLDAVFVTREGLASTLPVAPARPL